MRLKRILLPLVAVVLCGCSKTDMMYEFGAYDSPNFYLNYYSKNDTKDFIFTEKEETPINLQANDNLSGLKDKDKGNYVWEDYAGNRKEVLWGYHNNLAQVG